MKIKHLVLPVLAGLIAAFALSAVPRQTAMAQCYENNKPVPCEKEKKAKPTPIPLTATDTATPTPSPTSTPTSTPTATATATSVPPVAAGPGDPASQAASGVPWPVWGFYLGALAVAGAFIYLGMRLKALQKNWPPAQPPVPWQKHRESEGDAPSLEFTAAEPKGLHAELMFDMFEDRGAVPSPRDFDLPSLSPDTAGNEGSDGVHATVNPGWSADINLNPLRSDPPDVKYTLFLPDGTPVRDTVHVKMKQASKSSSKTTDDSTSSDSDPDKDSGG